MPLPVVAYSPAVSPSAPGAHEQASVTLRESTLREPTQREPTQREPTRTIVLWCPDWPVTAALQALGASADPAAPLALIEKGHVFACSPAARRDGVRRGLKLREAQYRCTDLLVSPYDPVQDARAFEPVISRIEEVTPGVQLIRPGACAIRARGPTRYYGGEEQAAAALVQCLDEFGVPGARVGIADGPFAAEQAARNTRDAPGAGLRIVPPHGSARFLAPLPIGILVDERMATLLRRLGVHTLGDFAALPAQDVLRRFGAAGAHAQEKAAGRDSRSVVPRVPAKVFDTRLEFEPALDRIDQVTFAIRAPAEEFILTLTQARLVCTAIRVEVRSESGQVAARSWLHPRWFTAADVVDRVRWQLQGSQAIDTPLTSGIASVSIAPERLDSTAHHEEGLWGSGPDERIHHGLTRVQSMLGHDGVLTAAIGGGRMLADRQILVPWGDRPPDAGGPTARPATQPWPGSLQALAPATVFRQPHAVALLDARGNPVDVDERGLVTGIPDRFSATGRLDDLRPVEGWAGPWPVTERWWDPERSRQLHRFQVVDADGDAWLLGLADHLWSAEARYD